MTSYAPISSYVCCNQGRLAWGTSQGNLEVEAREGPFLLYGAVLAKQRPVGPIL